MALELGEGGVEAAQAAGAGLERDVRHAVIAGVEQTLGMLDAKRLGELLWCCADMALEQPCEMTR